MAAHRPRSKAGRSLPVAMPPRWVPVGDGYAAPGVHASGLAPTLRHHATAHNGSLDSWHRSVVQADAKRPGFELEDDDRFELAGHEAVYRRFTHVVGELRAVCDQWLWLVDGIAHRLTGTVSVDDYVDYCDVFESVAETFDPSRPSRRTA